MSNSKNKSKEKIFFVQKANDGLVENIYKASFDPEIPPSKEDMICIRVDDLIKYPLEINTDPNQLSVIINNEYQVNFSSEIGEQSFYQDLFFFIETYHKVPKKQRITSKRKNINLEKELKKITRRTN